MQELLALSSPPGASAEKRALEVTVVLYSQDVQGDEYHIVLTLARIWYTLSTGRFTSKDAAADWLLPQLPEEYAATSRSSHKMPQDVCQVAQTAFLNYYLIGSHR